MSVLNKILKEKYGRIQTDFTTVMQLMDLVFKDEILDKLPEESRGRLLEMIEAIGSSNRDLKIMVTMTTLISLKESGVTESKIVELLNKLR